MYDANVLADWRFRNSFHFNWIGTNACAVNDVTTEMYQCSIIFSFGLVESKATARDLFQCSSEAKVVLLLRISEDYNVVHHAYHTLKTVEYFCHPFLKVLRYRRDTERPATIAKSP